MSQWLARASWVAVSLALAWPLDPSWVASAQTGPTPGAPKYVRASIVNGASYLPDRLAPNTIVTVFGEDLAFTTRALVPSDISDQRLPTALPGAGVRVVVRNELAGLFYVSPNQINLLIPGNLLPGRAEIRVVRQGLAGPPVEVYLDEVAPGLFLLDEHTAIATYPDGTLVGPGHPARPGEWVVLYATGLGRTRPPLAPYEIPRQAAVLEDLENFAVLLDGKAVPREHVAYVGVTPGFAGLYQINLRLPEDVAEDPEVRLEVRGRLSQPGVRLAVERLVATTEAGTASQE